jgi:hypothetical protein
MLETFLNHFDELFKNGIVSSLPEPLDNISSK